ncbi:Ubiquitin fusion degradation protein 1 [Rhynchospora pubera]|uniref:Ubiquitin fusion degradation protein 1 n=1 Tax=Rhynchospora pubera TaxID=906938 RepID=A0AAV8HA58_9POAL|nr:Ubiquitin fusion degradation protein 1 [Rhynchospora pubera]
MFFGRFLGGNSFEQTYRCYPSSFIDKPNLEAGDKIIMPPSALDRLAFLHIQYPMLFELHNDATNRISHCGVLEFVAEEGTIYMPYWMMQNMLLQEGDVVRVKNATLPKGIYVKLQPHTSDFLDISNPKAILETTLRNFSCLTTGDSIMVAYNNKKYYIDIIETKPASAISIIETDCEVDFAPPLDYKEPVKPSVSNIPSKVSTDKVTSVEKEPEPKFTPFTGGGKRLDGKPAKQQAPATTTDKDLQIGSDGKQQSTAAGSSGSGGPIRQKAGKLVFGSSGNTSTSKETQKIAAKEKEPEQTKKEEAKFQAFTGKKYSLKA